MLIGGATGAGLVDFFSNNSSFSLSSMISFVGGDIETDNESILSSAAMNSNRIGYCKQNIVVYLECV